MQINATGDASLILKKGNASPILCAERWEKIVAENSKANGKQDYNYVERSFKMYNSLLRDYNTVKACLLVLCYTIDFEYLKHVRAKGYAIDTTNSKTYADSLGRALRKSNNILTKIEMKRNELAALRQERKTEKPQTFEGIIASLTFQLGYTVPDDITVIRYNEYVKLIEQKQKALKLQRERHGRRT